MKTENILFRADSSSTIGTGHIMRDLVLAKQYKKSRIIFATQELEGDINHKIVEAGYELEILDTNKIEEIDTLIKKYDIELLVIDHYDIDYSFEKQLKNKNSKLKILSFDDTYEKHYCDILLNHNISADKKRYIDLVPKGCELRCGAEYTLIRDEFVEEKRRVKVFLAIGGADVSNINTVILRVLRKFRYIEVNLVTTTANSRLDRLKKHIKDKRWVTLHVNSTKLAKLMSCSDFAIVTPSVTVNEVYFMGLPFIAIKVAPNQTDMAEYLKGRGFLVMDSFDKKILKEFVTQIVGKNNEDRV